MTNTTKCSECGHENGEHEFSCAFSAKLVAPSEPGRVTWYAVTSDGRRLPVSRPEHHDAATVLDYCQRHGDMFGFSQIVKVER